MNQPTLREILEKYFSEDAEAIDHPIHQAEAAINQYLAWVIGEDDVVGTVDNVINSTNIHRNFLRQVQLKRAGL